MHSYKRGRGQNEVLHAEQEMWKQSRGGLGDTGLED